MFAFDFHNPTKSIFGQQTIARLDSVIPAGSSILDAIL